MTDSKPFTNFEESVLKTYGKSFNELMQGNLGVNKKIQIVEHIFANNLEKNYAFVCFI